MYNIGITGIGSPLGQSIMQACQLSERKYQSFGMDTDRLAEGIFDDVPFICTPSYSDSNYIEVISDIISTNRIDLLFFGSEKEMINFTEKQDQLQEFPCKVAVGNLESYKIGTDKYEIVRFLKENKLPYPKTVLLLSDFRELEHLVKDVGFPLIIKSRRAGPVYIVNDWDDVIYHRKKYKDAILQEFLGKGSGVTEELTVGAFYTQVFGVADLIIFERELKYGLSWRCKRVENFQVEQDTRKILDLLKPTGSINLQFRKNNDQYMLHEINMRCSSTTAFRALCGWNEIDMAVDSFIEGKKPQIPKSISSGRGIRFFAQKWVNE